MSWAGKYEFGRGQTKLDAIVGIQTIHRLDAEIQEERQLGGALTSGSPLINGQILQRRFP